jgi:hypothetical protein
VKKEETFSLKFEFTQSLNVLTIGNATDPLNPLISTFLNYSLFDHFGSEGMVWGILRIYNYNERMFEGQPR